MGLIPLNKNVVVKIDEKVMKTSGGLYMTDTSEKPRISGVVIEVGEEIEHITVGDHVLVTYKDAYPTTEKDVWIFPYDNLLAKIV